MVQFPGEMNVMIPVGLSMVHTSSVVDVKRNPVWRPTAVVITVSIGGVAEKLYAGAYELESMVRFCAKKHAVPPTLTWPYRWGK